MTGVRIKAGWQGEGRLGTLLAGPIRDLKGQDWMVVQWESEDDPGLHKCTGLEVAVTQWQPVSAGRPHE